MLGHHASGGGLQEEALLHGHDPRRGAGKPIRGQCSRPRDPGPRPQSIVLTREGYRSLLHLNLAYSNVMKTVMARSTLLYMGFSHTDGYFNEIRSEIMTLKIAAESGTQVAARAHAHASARGAPLLFFLCMKDHPSGPPELPSQPPSVTVPTTVSPPPTAVGYRPNHR